jgi:GT2 family glycosyltransferase
MSDSRVSVVVPCHTERRWAELVASVDSVLAQDPRPAEVVVVVDHNEALLDRARRELSGVTVLPNRFQRGVSGNRNTGAFRTSTPLIAMLDGDARARPGWLAGLLAPFEDPNVVGAGGAILPDWETHQPFWFPDEFLWAVGASYAGMPTRTAPARNVWSASMAVRRDAFESVGGFRVGFGKLGDRSRPEDTDLCLRMSAAGSGRWIYVPYAIIDHPVPVAQTRIGYFLNRCYNEGRGKVELARLNKGRESLGSERDYLRRALPRAVGRGLARALRGRGVEHAAKAGGVLVGVGAAALGGAVESLRVRRRLADTAPVVAHAGGGE